VESIAIILYSLGGLVAAPVFCYVVARIVRKAQHIAKALWYVAISILWLAAGELLVVTVFGSVRVRGSVGPAFVPVHVILAFFAAPALACAMLLGRRHVANWWPAVAAMCWIVGVAAIFYHYGVMEALYGVDGEGGPYAASNG